MKFYANKKGLAITYAAFFCFFGVFSIPVGGVFLIINDKNTFAKLSEIVSNKPLTNIEGAISQFRIAFFFIILMCLLTGFMYSLTAKSRELTFRFFSVALGIYTFVALGYKVIISAALKSTISKISDPVLKAQAPMIAKTFENKFVIFGITGVVLSLLFLLIGLLGKRSKEN